MVFTSIMHNDRTTDSLFLILLCLYITLVLCAWTTATKLVALPFGLSASVGTLIAYGFCFLITDLISEIYGYKAARTTVRLGFMTAAIGLCLLQLASALPPAEGYEGQQAFEETLGYPIRIIIGGLIAYFLSQQVDIFLFHLLKKKTKGQHLWLRNNISTLCAQLLDSFVWVTIAFYGVIPNIENLIAGEYFIKAIIAVLDTSLIYLILYTLRKNKTNIVLKTARQA